MQTFFSRIQLVDVYAEIWRNVVSIRTSQDLFDDLTDDASGWLLAQRVEREVKPPPYRSLTPAIHRPFEDAIWFNAIDWPFTHWQASRYSDGTFGVWYGSDSIETTVYETAYHWYHRLILDAGFENERVTSERQVYNVFCEAALLDLRKLIEDYPALVRKDDYSYTQAVGRRIHREGHPGLLTMSARHTPGANYVVFNPAVLSNPSLTCPLTYGLDGRRIVVEKAIGTTWMEVAITDL